MLLFLLAFCASFLANWLIIRYKDLHLQLSVDGDFSGPQKFHKIGVPRIGGVGIVIGIFISTSFIFDKSQHIGIIFLISCMPAFFAGLAEDLTKEISIRARLLFILVSAFLMVYYLNLEIHNLDIIFIDPIFSIPLMSLCFTLFAITGLTNAYNIIDGFNGLSSVVGIITLVAISYISIQHNDLLILSLCLAMIGSISGFLIWNYPGGRIFLGDGGAYIIGLWIATICIFLTNRHPEISPWFALLVNGYPVFETLFTIYRRKIYQGKNPGLPDGLHFHTLIYRRILLRRNSMGGWVSANARTAPYLWALSTACIIPAVLYHKSTLKLIATALIFTFFYLWVYQKIVRFKTPRWLH